MATAKKTTAKKTSPVKKNVAKKSVTKKSVTKKTPAKRAVSAKKSAASNVSQMRSFRISPDYPSFTTFKITRQTVYWVIIVSFIIFMQLWILSLQMETSTYIENQMSALNENM